MSLSIHETNDDNDHIHNHHVNNHHIMIIIMIMMAVVMGLDDLENKRGDQMNMAMVGLSTVKNYK